MIPDERKAFINNEVKDEVIRKFGETLANKNTDEIYFTYSLLETEKVACVYFVRNENGQVKIGKTKDLKKRLQQISTTVKNYANQKVLIERLIIAPEYFISEIETELHHFYKDKRAYGEWFDVEDYTDDYAYLEEFYSRFELSNGCVVDLYEEFDPKDRKILFNDMLDHCNPGLYGMFLQPFKSELEYELAVRKNIRDSTIFKLTDFCSHKEIKIESFDYTSKVKNVVYVGKNEWQTYDIHKALLEKINTVCEILHANMPVVIDA